MKKSAFNDIKNSDIERAIDEYVHSARDRMILKKRYIDGLLIADLSEEFCLSEDAIKSIVYGKGDYILAKLK